MTEMCSKLPIISCDTSSQLVTTAAVTPGKSVARPISTGPPVTIISPWSPPPPPTASCSWLQPVSAANRVESDERGRGNSRLPSSALTQELLRFRWQELNTSAREVSSGNSTRSSSKRISGDEVLVRNSQSRVCGVSSLRATCERNYHHHCKTEGLVGSRDRSRLLPVVPGGFPRRRARGHHLGLPALSCRGGGCVVERKNFSRAYAGNAVCPHRFCGLSGKKTSGNFERMELFKPQLMDTVQFRFLSEYHTTPPRAVKDAISPICFFGFGQVKPVVEVVQAGDPVLHEPAAEVRPDEIGSARIEKIINDMVATMRNAPGVGLAAPQIGVNLQIIVLEDTKELMSCSSPEECAAQQRFPFDLLVIINPKLKTKSGSGSAVFFEGCLSVEGYRGLVERNLDVEVSGLCRDGRPIRVEASGWKARILQHEFDHLSGTLYVDKMVPRTFRTKDNLRLPLPAGCPKQGVCKHSTKSLKL